MVSPGFKYAISCRRLFTSLSRNRVRSNMVGSGRKAIFVPVLLVFPITGSVLSGFSFTVGVPFS